METQVNCPPKQLINSFVSLYGPSPLFFELTMGWERNNSKMKREGGGNKDLETINDYIKYVRVL